MSIAGGLIESGVPARTSILFLCTGNSARSILAEAIANGRYGDRLIARSAGSAPRGEVHPLALETLRRHGVDSAGLHSKRWDAFPDEPFDLVITLCNNARDEQCPALPGRPTSLHWDLPDPPAADDPPAAFEAVYRKLDEALARVAAGGMTGARTAMMADSDASPHH